MIMKWFAIIFFASTHAGNNSIVPVESEAECLALITAISLNENIREYTRETVLKRSVCVSF